jgi:hypothetical protein
VNATRKFVESRAIPVTKEQECLRRDRFAARSREIQTCVQ